MSDNESSPGRRSSENEEEESQDFESGSQEESNENEEMNDAPDKEMQNEDDEEPPFGKSIGSLSSMSVQSEIIQKRKRTARNKQENVSDSQDGKITADYLLHSFSFYYVL